MQSSVKHPPGVLMASRWAMVRRRVMPKMSEKMPIIHHITPESGKMMYKMKAMNQMMQVSEMTDQKFIRPTFWATAGTGSRVQGLRSEAAGHRGQGEEQGDWAYSALVYTFPSTRSKRTSTMGTGSWASRRCCPTTGTWAWGCAPEHPRRRCSPSQAQAAAHTAAGHTAAAVEHMAGAAQATNSRRSLACQQLALAWLSCQYAAGNHSHLSQCAWLSIVLQGPQRMRKWWCGARSLWESLPALNVIAAVSFLPFSRKALLLLCCWPFGLVSL